MNRRNLIRTLILVTSALAGASCSEDIDECPSKLCITAGGWRLTAVELDGVPYETDYSNYRLILNDPSPSTETVSSFERTSVEGSADNGTWEIENSVPGASTPFNGTILRLTPGNNVQFREDWEIESVTPRVMIIILRRDTSIKGGPGTIRFVLERFS